MNTPINCLVIEDEPLAQELLKDYIESFPMIKLVGTAKNGHIGLKLCQQLKPDLILLDIRMPGMTGLQFLEMLPKPHPLVILTTAYSSYALDGYEYAVVDFLVKPVNYDRFSQAIKRVYERLGKYSLNRDQIAPGGDDFSVNKFQLTVRYQRALINIAFQDITLLESYDNYVKIHHRDPQLDQPLLTKITISELEEKLKGLSFIRINRKYIVPFNQIKGLKSNSIIHSNGLELPIGITYRETVRRELEQDWLP